MCTNPEYFWKQFSKENNMVLFKGDWNQFCKAKNADEETLKKLLFKGNLSEKEFQSIVFCIIITVPFEQPILYYPVLFKQCPQLMERCNWDMLNNLDWLILLDKYPQFADKFDKWDEFDGEDWSCLLCEQPQFANKCDKWDYFDSDAWFELLYTQPQFADKCDIWDEFEGIDWANLLSAQPQFADKCNKWDEFDGYDWSYLLAEQPQFADKCDWTKLNSNTYHWVKLLQEQPQLIKYCNTSIITEKDKAKLLAKHPDLAKYFKNAEKKVDNNQPELF